MTKESEALAVFLSACIDGDMNGDNMKKAMAEYVKQPATAPEQCWCDEQNIGEPGVSCGDCPTRDYKHPATAPAWHDAPTVPGLWVCRQAITDNVQAYEVTDQMALNRNLKLKGQWYGPIPEDRQ